VASHTFNVLSVKLPPTIRRPSGWKAKLEIAGSHSLQAKTSWPLLASNTFTPGPAPQAIRRPSGLRAQPYAVSGPATVISNRPLARSHTFQSRPTAPMSRRPSGVNVAPSMSCGSLKIRAGSVSKASQNLSVSSALPLTIRRPSGLKATDWTESSCPVSVSSSWPLAASYTFNVLSLLPLTIRRPSRLKATLFTLPRCPRSVSNSRPLAASQTLSECSLSPPTIRRPSRLKATP
jgi:hypothetical protein